MTHASLAISAGKKVFVVLVALAMALTWMAQAQADGTAANKLAVSGSTVQRFGPNSNVVLLSETMKVSSVRDLILQVSAECSIITALDTSDETKKSVTGQIEMWLEVDGVPVKVSDDDTGAGKTVFCNRTYERQITDTEDPEDGVDREQDFIRTRTANAFNWVALDAGTFYDDPANGNNVLNIVLKANLTQVGSGTCAFGGTCSEAIVGKRTLVIENTNAQNTEVITEQDPNPAPPPPAPCPTYPICT